MLHGVVARGRRIGRPSHGRAPSLAVMAPSDDGDAVDRILAASGIALDEGGALAVLDEAVAVARSHDDARLDRRLVELRHAAFEELDRRPGRARWPVELADPFPGRDDVPRASGPDLSGELLGGALVHHGCLRVDGLISEGAAAELRDRIDRGFEARARVQAGAPPESGAPWFVPFAPGQERATGFGSGAFLRVVDAPGALGLLAEAFAATGVTGAITDYFAERPAMIANKWVMRRTLTGKAGTDFHQDGAFLGDDIRTVDCWIALSACGPGTGRPAMDIVPRRFDVLASGDGAAFPWSLTEETVQAAAPGAPVVSPVFGPGDALLFDERLPHRTTVGTDLDVRYAIESWFVAPSSYPARHVPVVL